MKVPLAPGSEAWRALRRAQRTRAAQAAEDAPDGALPRSKPAALFWSQRTWSELAAVPAVSQVVLALVREGASLATLGAYASIASDEVRHAQLSRQLAQRLGGYVEEVPEGLAYAPRSLAQPSGVALAVWALANGCYSETVSLALIRARHAATRHPVVRAVLAQTLKDEAVHVRVSWQLAQEVLPALPASQRRELADYGGALGQMLRSTFGTQALPAPVRGRERALRDATAARGLGALPALAEDAIVETALEELQARLRALGVRR